MKQEPGWDLYRTFLAVLREGSLSKAGQTLGLTQPTVARHVDALEQHLGSSLFLRTSRGLSPTDSALELKPYADLLGSTAAALLRTAEGRAGEVQGTVRISASEVVGVEHLPAILSDLRQRYSALTIELVLSNEMEDLLQRKADIAVRMIRPTQAALLAQKVGVFSLGLHAHRDYLARRGIPDKLTDLMEHDVIGYDTETPAIRSMLQHFPMLTRASFALRVDSDIAQLAAIRAGFGIGVYQLAVAASDPELVRVLPREFGADLETWVVMHEDLKTSARCRVVFNELVEQLRLTAS